MLFFISWGRFATVIFLSTAIYSTIILLLFYRAKVFDWIGKKPMMVLLSVSANLAANAQDGNQGISQANTMIRGYFDTGVTLVYAIGALLALVGAIKVFRELNAGHQQEAFRAAAGWFGGCLFLLVVVTAIKTFFGL